jgi:hypothetical protein
MKCDTRIHRLEFISLSFCSQLFKRNGVKYKIQYYLEKKEVSRIEYPAIRATSFVSIVVYLQRKQRVFYISHYSVTEIEPLHDGSVAENTTEQVNWYFTSAVVSSWKGLTFIIRVFFPRYSVEIIVEEINICVVNTIY